MVLNYVWGWRFSVVVFLTPKVCSIDLHKKFKEQGIFTFSKVKLLNWNWKLQGVFQCFWNLLEKILLRTNHCDTKGLVYWWFGFICVVSMRIHFYPLYRDNCAYSSSDLFGQKPVLTRNYKLQTLILTEKTREPIIKVYMVFQRCSVFFYRQEVVY